MQKNVLEQAEIGYGPFHRDIDTWRDTTEEKNRGSVWCLEKQARKAGIRHG